MDTFIAVGLIFLATHRLTVLVVADRLPLLARPRQRVQNYFERRAERSTGIVTTDTWQSQIAYLLSCLWCSSIWVGGAVTVATALFTHVPLPVLVWLAASSVTALLGGPRGD